MEGGGALLRDIVPRLGDATVVTPFDAHYFYMSSWAMRRVYERAPSVHVDVGGSAALIACLAAIVPTVFVDYRPLVAQLPGMCSVGGDVRTLPFKTQSVESLSCLHVAEHVGLGRYGDPLDPMGTARAADELARVLAPKGTLLFAIPVGRDRVHFNAHRVLAPEAVVGIFPSLSLEEFSVVTDEDRFVDGVEVGSLGDARYSCGLFRFVRR
jgi:hypothetical protein